MNQEIADHLYKIPFWKLMSHTLALIEEGVMQVESITAGPSILEGIHSCFKCYNSYYHRDLRPIPPRRLQWELPPGRTTLAALARHVCRNLPSTEIDQLPRTLQDFVRNEILQPPILTAHLRARIATFYKQCPELQNTQCVFD